MSILEATEFFENLLNTAKSKREKRVYKSYVEILSNLKGRDLSDGQLSEIENKLKTLDLNSNPDNKRRFFSKKLSIFKQFLKTEYSLISEGYYTAIGMSLGMCFGVAFGTVFGASGTPMGLALGMLIGLAVGRYMDMAAEKENKVLKNKVSSL